MAYGVPLISARDQWFQWTYAVLPNGNWDAGGQHLVILDNGEVWVHMTRLTSFTNATPWDEPFGVTESSFNWLGKVHPSGNERVLGDEFVYGSSSEGDDLGFGYPYPKSTDTSLPASAFTHRSIAANGTLVTDGTSIFVYLPQAVTDWRGSWYKINPTDLTFVKIAGAEGSGSTPYVNDPIGLNATFYRPGQCQYHDGYIYFVDSWETTSGNPMARTVRRMSLTPPYPVETVTPDFNTPSGYPGNLGGASTNTWFEALNPATGLANVFNDDILLTVGSGTEMTGFQIWEDHMYFVSAVRANPHDFFYIKRCPLEGGPLETLFYGLGVSSGAGSITHDRDNSVDSTEFPIGIQHPTVLTFWQEANHYTPELEGIDHQFTTILISPDGGLFVQNWAGGTFTGGGNEWGVRICRFDLPILIADYEAYGPQRVNRADPQWDTLNNGNAFWEGGGQPPWTPDVRKRWWSGRDGENSLISHVLVTGWGLNWNVPQWDGKIVFIHPEISVTTSPLGLSNSTANAMMVGVLQEEGGGPMDVRLNFEGVALKGYGYQPGMAKAWAPEEVTLT